MKNKFLLRSTTIFSFDHPDKSKKSRPLFSLLLLLMLMGFGADAIAQITSAGTGMWSSTSTWTGGVVPGNTDDVIIADGHTVTIDQAVTITSITVGQGTSGMLTFDGIAARAVSISNDLTVSAGATFITQSTGTFTNTMTIGGNIINNGTLDLSKAGSSTICNVTFNKIGTQTITGNPVLTRFRIITLDKGAVSNKLISSSNIFVAGAQGFTTGTWEHIADTLRITSTNQIIGASSALVISGTASFEMPGSSFTVNGELTVNTTGSFSMGTGNNSFIPTASTANVNFTSGTVNIYGRLTLTGGSTTINGANIFIDPQSTNNLGITSNCFEVAAAANFNFSSGTVTIVDPILGGTTGREIRFRLASTGLHSITGGTIYLGDGTSTSSGTGFKISVDAGFPALNNFVIQTGAVAERAPTLSTNNTLINGTLSMISGVFTGTNIFNYGATGTLVYQGSIAQTTANVEFPATAGPNSLSINNAAGVTLHAARTVNNLLLTNGLFSLGGFDLTIPDLGTVQRSAGSISGTPVYAGYADFLYTNTALISSHPELPSTNNTIRNLTMNGTGGLTLANEIYVKGTLTLTNGIITSTPVNFLQLGPNDGGALIGAVSGGNGSSYVFGPVRRNYENNLMTTLKLYPVGSLGKYRPIMVNMSHSSATATLYQVTIIEPNDLWTAGNLGSIFKVSPKRRYDVDEIGVSGNAINNREVTLWWNDDDGVSNYATLTLGAYDEGGGSNKWKKLNAATSTAPSGGDLGYLYGELNPNDVFKYAVATEDVENVLPISVEYFRGSKQSNGNLLDWKVSCTGSPYATLVLERSADGRNFIVVNSQEATALRCLSPFNFTDAGALPGINFYRLKLVDADGKYSYSQIVALLNTEKGYEIVSMMPNPAREKAILSISSAVKTTLDLVISDISGKQLSKQRTSLIAGSNQLALNLSDLAAGTYQVTAITAEGVLKSIRFVKQ